MLLVRFIEEYLFYKFLLNEEFYIFYVLNYINMMLNGWKIFNYNWKYMRMVFIKIRELEYKLFEIEKLLKIRICVKVNWGGL